MAKKPKRQGRGVRAIRKKRAIWGGGMEHRKTKLSLRSTEVLRQPSLRLKKRRKA